MKNVAQIFDHDIYYVEETADGKKRLNIQRYYFQDELIVACEYCGLRLEIPCTREQANDAILESKQYVGPVSLDCSKASKEVEDDIADAKPLPIDKVTQTTPCGKYIDINQF